MRVVLAEDLHLLREGLIQLLRAHGFDIVAAVESGPELSAALAEHRPDVAVIDVRLPDGDGVTVCREIRSLVQPPPACLMLTSYSDDEALFGAIMAGASGYMLKEVSGNDLVAAVRSLASGGSLLHAGVTATVLQRLRGGPEEDPRYAALSPQERRILDLIAEGMTNRQIANRLFLAEKTVKNYVSSLLHKLGFDRRTEAGVYAARRRRTHPGAF